jgi:O6-methylguanine-DNA--protein-cysteine methyltransferase
VQYDTIKRMTFKEKVHAVVRRIPRGKTMTYLEVAKAAPLYSFWNCVSMNSYEYRRCKNSFQNSKCGFK